MDETTIDFVWWAGSGLCFGGFLGAVMVAAFAWVEDRIHRRWVESRWEGIAPPKDIQL